ncbi:MAG: host attachment protein [Woeseiaceae bacterium]
MPAAIPAGDKHYLVVVADEASAILYMRDTLYGPLTKWRTLSNDAARMKTEALISDRGGRSFDSHGQGRHTMGGEKAGPKQHIATVFAKTIAELVADDMQSGRCRGFALIAAPRFLGELRREIRTLVKTEPYATVNKAVAVSDESVIEKLLVLR